MKKLERNVLIVSPHFPPTNTADLHRVRTLLPFLSRFGWNAKVLAVEPSSVDAPRDPWLVTLLPEEVPIRRIRGLGRAWSRVPGFGGLGFRALSALAAEGDKMMRGWRPDIVYFSTTVFEVHAASLWWRRRHGVPYVIDYQDPWVNDYYRQHPSVVPPGGRMKFGVVDLLHRWLEPRVLRYCSGITSVSSAYPRQLMERYPWLDVPTLVQPFPAPSSDFALLPTSVTNRHFDPSDGLQHWVYVGRGGADMSRALGGLFGTLRDPEISALTERLRIHFIGTSYARAGTGELSVMPIARRFGVDQLVSESPDRIPYSEALACLRDASVLIVPGSDDPGYTASKLYPYLLTGKPLLAVFHEQSSVVRLMNEVGGGVCVTFSQDTTTTQLSERIRSQWFRAGNLAKCIPVNRDALRPYMDEACAEEITSFFERCIARGAD